MRRRAAAHAGSVVALLEPAAATAPPPTAAPPIRSSSHARRWQSVQHSSYQPAASGPTGAPQQFLRHRRTNGSGDDRRRTDRSQDAQSGRARSRADLAPASRSHQRVMHIRDFGYGGDAGMAHTLKFMDPTHLHFSPLPPKLQQRNEQLDRIRRRRVELHGASVSLCTLYLSCCSAVMTQQHCWCCAQALGVHGNNTWIHCSCSVRH